MQRQAFHSSPRPAVPDAVAFAHAMRNLERLIRSFRRGAACPELVTRAPTRTWRWALELEVT